MAAPTYATDLTTIVDFDGTPGSPSVSEPSTGWTSGRSPTTDTDFPIQGTNHASLTMNTTGKAGILCTNGATGWTSGDYLFGWIVWLAPGAIDSEANGGLAMLCGNSTSSYKVYYIGGNSSGLYPYGGWQNFAVDPTITEDETFGSPSTYNVVGAGANVLSAVSKGNPLGFDVFRYGRGELQVSAGDGTTPATFTGMAAANDASSARWGLFQQITGGYKYKGLITLGSGSACTFVDANKTITIEDTKYCQSNFNAIRILNASSSISWTNITITSLSTVSPGQISVVEDATVTFDSCTFTDMGLFSFRWNTTANSTFRRCGQIFSGGATLAGSLVTGYTGVTSTGGSPTANTSAVVWNVPVDPDGYLDDMTFVKGTTATHALEFGLTAPTTLTLNGMTFSGYNASNNQDDSALHIRQTSGTVTINLTNGTTAPSYRTDGATVVIQSSVTLTIGPLVAGSAVTIADATDQTVYYDNGSTGTSANFVYNAASLGGEVTNVVIIEPGYEPFEVKNYVLSSSNSSLNVSQNTDDIFDNP